MPKDSKFNKDSLLPLPEQFHDDEASSSDPTSSLVHLSESSVGQPSRNNSPFVNLPHSDNWTDDNIPHHTRADDDDQDEDDFAWDEQSPLPESSNPSNMPSDLRSTGHRQTDSRSHTQPLLADRDKHSDYASPVRPPLAQRRSTFRERDPTTAADVATRRKYTYAAFFLVLSLISFTVQTETAVYIQHTLKWNKAYCMLYVILLATALPHCAYSRC